MGLEIMKTYAAGERFKTNRQCIFYAWLHVLNTFQSLSFSPKQILIKSNKNANSMDNYSKQIISNGLLACIFSPSQQMEGICWTSTHS